MNILAFSRHVAATLLLALLPFVVLGTQASAQTIQNTANATWSFKGEVVRTVSNTVMFDVVSSPPRIRTFAPVQSGGDEVTFTEPSCIGTQSGLATANAAPKTSVSASIIETTTIKSGLDIIFEVLAVEANTDPGVIDTLVAVIESATGDREEIVIYETGADTGIFFGSITTRRMLSGVEPGNCSLSVTNGSEVTISTSLPNHTEILVSADVQILADPFGIVFDSETGEPVSNATVTLVDATTGQPARVFAEDGTTLWPSTVISGQTITDAAGNHYQMGPGEYWFPLTFLGSYRIEITPPPPYTAPTAVSREELARLSRPDGRSFIIEDASFGGILTLVDAERVQIDIPIDRPSLDIGISKSVSRQKAQPGDALFYTITARNTDQTRPKRSVVLVDTPSRWLRLRPESVRVDGVAAPDIVDLAPDGSQLRFTLGDMAPGAERRITYAMVIRADAPPGQAVNRADITDSLGRTSTASAAFDIEHDNIAGRMTIIGRVTAGDCQVGENRIGIPGVRVMMEDGSFAVTDADGRYHFEGVVPGTHVVQAAQMTLPEGGRFVDCTRSTRSAGSSNSQMVIGQGGSLARVDFHAVIPDEELARLTQLRERTELNFDSARRETGEAAAPGTGEISDVKNASQTIGTDWLALGDGPDGWLSPAIDHNPRAPVVKVAIRHRKGQKVNLSVDGKAADPLTFEGTREASDGKYAVSLWRGVPLVDEQTELSAEIVNSFGVVNETITRTVHFVSKPARAETVPDQSILVADGKTNPILAVRILDRNGRPVRGGVAGEFTLNEPFQSAAQLELQQLQQLTGTGNLSARWVIEGDDGIAKIELAPTLVSGSLRLEFRFEDETIVRTQMLEAWIEPGDIEWTVIGLAEGSIGAQTVADNMERSGTLDSDFGDKARVALYAKGRVLGKYLLTLAYDSAKQREDQRILGALDPNAYYTVFADASSRRFDAPSREKLYVRIETTTFYALYGDFDTGFDQTQLARYNRTATGVKAEARIGSVDAQGFAAKVGTRFRRDEIQGNGLSGPYRLGSRDIIANSEQVTIEVRDRFRSELIVSTRALTRFIDYDIDVLSGTISFTRPIASRDFELNPQFIVIEYEISSLGNGEWNVGGRAAWTDRTDTIRIGATGITDKGDGQRTNIGAIDLRARVGEATEIRTEIALSEREGETSSGWLVEAQHQSGKLDVLAYARSLQSEYGVGAQNGAEQGRRKVGVDIHYEIDHQFSVLASAWQDDNLADAGRRRAAQTQLAYQANRTELHVGLTHFSDRLTNGDRNNSTVLESGITQRLLDNRLEMSASTSFALEDAESVDLPARYRFDARYAIVQDVRLMGTYEIADGKNIDARTLRAGVEVAPWQGGRVVSTLGKQQIDEYGNRSFAAFGLSQTIQVTPSLTIDATLDDNHTLGGGAPLDDIVNLAQPVASGGHIGQDGSVFEDYTAVTLGAAWRRDRWSATGRAEYRDGEFASRKGMIFGAIRQLGEGSMVGSGFTWTTAKASNGVTTEILDGSIAIAHRPDESEFSFLGKLEYRSDAVSGAIAGEAGPAGRTGLLVDGDATSRRLITSLSTNFAPQGRDERGQLIQRTEIGLFLGTRYNFDRFEGLDLDGFTALAGLDMRYGITDKFELGGKATIRSNIDDGVISFAIGPQVGFTPAKGVLVAIGYNVNGFRDRDFSAARQTDKGIFASIRAKFDTETFAVLGLGR